MTRTAAPRRPWAALLVAAAVAPACGAPRLSTARTPDCVPYSRTQQSLELHVGQRVEMPEACPTLGVLQIITPIALYARPDGLQVSFDVRDPSYVPGGLRQDQGERDAVVAYPQGEGPGRPVLELATTARQGGYRVEDVVPWDAWGMTEPTGDFVLNLSLLDRERTGAETELRVRVAVRLPPLN